LKKRGKGIIISDHNYETILRLSDKVLLLWEGYVTRVKEREDLIRCGYIRF
jgi:ABC-type cobalamin transport system ATPase subunit